LISWYAVSKRDLPWRCTKDPYFIWLSEIILQQTRIEQGKPYYERFAAAYPTVDKLAAASEQDVLKHWQGLGYYSRARNMHETARVVMKEFGGKFPHAYEKIRKLKGVGDYTAAAIASISFGLPYAVMDGNVLRFLSRYSGITDSIDLPAVKKKILAIANTHMDQGNPGDFNQALMEFGATVCTPSSPDCKNCIFQTKCNAFIHNAVGEIPVRTPKTGVRQRFIHYLVITVTIGGKDHIYLRKRTGKDIWRNLYDFPSLERPEDKTLYRLHEMEFSGILQLNQNKFHEVSEAYLHVLTHQKLHVRFYRFRSTDANLPYLLIPLTEIHNYPVPRLIEGYISSNLH
jgi:A/G-specific adenine glycosylase